MAVKMTKYQQKVLQKKIDAMQKELDVSRIQNRATSILNGMVSNEKFKDVLLKDKYTNSCIEYAISCIVKSDEVVGYFTQKCEEKYNEEQAKAAKKSAATQKSSVKSSAQKGPDIDAILQMHDGVAGAVAPTSIGSR